MTQKVQLLKSPSQTIHAQCHYYVQSISETDVKNCTGHVVLASGQPCPFFDYRMGQKRVSIKIIRKFCIQCMGGCIVFVRKCETQNCFLHSYRLGKNPARSGIGQNADGMAIVRAKKQPVSLKNSVKFQ
jgi:hypothetical protein